MSNIKKGLLILVPVLLLSCASSNKTVTSSASSSLNKTEVKKEFIKTTPFDLRGDAAVALIVAAKKGDVTDEVGYIKRYGIYNGEASDSCQFVSVIRTEWGKEGASVMNYKVCNGEVKKNISSTNETVPDNLMPLLSKSYKELKSGSKRKMKIEKDRFLIEGERERNICKLKVLEGMKLLYYTVFKCLK